MTAKDHIKGLLDNCILEETPASMIGADRWSKSIGESRSMANLNEIDSQLLGLPSDERARLARMLLVSLDEQIDDDVEAAWKVEAEKRFQEYKNGQVGTIEGKDAMREARQALR